MRLIFKYETVSPSGLNQDFSFTWIARFSLASLEFGHVSLFNELFNDIVLYPEEGSIAETSPGLKLF